MSIIIPQSIRSVCFTGHRELDRDECLLINKRLDVLLSRLTENHGLQNCYLGGALGMDTLAALSVLRLKQKYPQLSVNLILPCQGQERSWSDEQKKIYYEIKERADSVRILAPFFYNGCMQARNRELLLSSDLCIAYLRKGTSSGGSLNTVIQASKLGVCVINIADSESESIK